MAEKGYEPVRLTQYASSAGCAAKMGAADLSSVLATIPGSDDPRLLVGRTTFDDAAAFLINDDLALIQTVDFFPPIVDDPYLFGQIAAANALSDVYAMGGQPLTALNIVAFPSDVLGPEVLTQILLGGEDKVREADAIVVGGHTILDREIKYGMAVTGKAHPRFLLTNAGARVGDKLVLTKPLGTGIITTAVKQGFLTVERAQPVFTSMTILNGAASRAALAVGATCATDVTGFSLLGHASHIARASGVSIRINVRDVPIFDWVEEALSQGVHTAGGARNVAYLEDLVDWGSASATDRAVLTDPQTSGGLLVAVAANKLDRFLMRVTGAVPIGDVIQPGDAPLLVV
ncbi:MAG: selenide, water dikinase SelD [Gemmatimonadaceae bacterium]